MSLEIQTGTPPADGRYVVWMPCAARQVREWCEPSIQTWQGGRWHHGEPVHCWIGPLPVVNTKTGEIAAQTHITGFRYVGKNENGDGVWHRPGDGMEYDL